MPEPDEPPRDELPEIGRRLCGLLGVKPREPVTASSLRIVADEQNAVLPPERWPVLYAIRICADAMADHALPREIVELRNAVDAYARERSQSRTLRQDAVRAIERALPLLETEAALRARAMDAALTPEERAAGAVPTIWPSPEALTMLPRELLAVLGREAAVVDLLRKALHDLSRLDADPLIATRFAPTNIRMAKALKLAGCSVAEIATIIKPFEDGPARKQARNTVQRYLQSKSEDILEATYPIARDAPDKAEQLKELDEAAQRIYGFGGPAIRPVIATARDNRDDSEAAKASDTGPGEPKEGR